VSDLDSDADALRIRRAEVARHTPARVFADRSGLAYRTNTWLELRRDHALAVDAVHAELDLQRDLIAGGLADYGLFEVGTCAESRREYLLRPDLGRRLAPSAREAITQACPIGCDLQIVVGDGLSTAAVIAQVPPLLPKLQQLAVERRWRTGRPFLVRNCRVGILNEVGELLSPRVVVLLIGERPGLMTAESLSAYMAFQPRTGDTDARRNLISNIHAQGVSPPDAAQRIVRLAEQMMTAQQSGIHVKESTGWHVLEREKEEG